MCTIWQKCYVRKNLLQGKFIRKSGEMLEAYISGCPKEIASEKCVRQRPKLHKNESD